MNLVERKYMERIDAMTPKDRAAWPGGTRIAAGVETFVETLEPQRPKAKPCGLCRFGLRRGKFVW